MLSHQSHHFWHVANSPLGAAEGQIAAERHSACGGVEENAVHQRQMRLRCDALKYIFIFKKNRKKRL